MYKLGEDLRNYQKIKTDQIIFERLFLILISAFTVSATWMIVDFGVISALSFLITGIIAAIILEII